MFLDEERGNRSKIIKQLQFKVLKINTNQTLYNDSEGTGHIFDSDS